MQCTLTANPVTTTYNISKNLVITLKKSNGKPINGAVLTVNWCTSIFEFSRT